MILLEKIKKNFGNRNSSEELQLNLDKLVN